MMVIMPLITEPVRVVAAVFRRDGLVLACRRAADRPAGGRWEFPGGKIEPGETPQQALCREIGEELGVAITVGALLDISRTNIGDTTIELSCYLVEQFHPDPVISTDHDQLAWRQPADLPTMDFAEPDLPAVRLIASS
jgi:8-oxo-dGTP diphosphatase